MVAGVEDITHLLDNEQGTAFDERTLMFADYADGYVFDYGGFREREISVMLDRDGKAATLEQVLALPIRRATPTIRRGQSTKQITNFIENAMFAPANNGGMTVSIETIIAQMCQAQVYKKTFFEKVLTERDGRVVYDKLAWRPQSTCRVIRNKPSGSFAGFEQRAVVDGTDPKKFGPQRAFVYIHGAHRNPLEGYSNFEIPYWCYQTKQKIRFLWYQFLEGQSLPKTIVRADTIDVARRAAKQILGLRSGGIAAVEGDKEALGIDPFESSGKGATQFKEALQWLDSESSGSVLAGFTDLGAAAAGGTGSFALSKDQTDFFLISRQAVAREMQDALNQFVIPDLVRYNFGPAAISPTFEFAPIAQDDANMAVNLLGTVNATPGGGNLPREFMEELIERVAGYLDMNTQKVRDGLDRAAKEAAEQAAVTSDNPAAPAVAGVAGAVSAATQAVQTRQVETQQAQTERPPRGQRANGNPARPRIDPRSDPAERRLRPA